MFDAIDEHVAGVRLEQPDNVLDGDGFAAAGEADDDHRLAFHDIERETFEDVLRAERLVDVAERDHGKSTGIRDPGSEDRAEQTTSASDGALSLASRFTFPDAGSRIPWRLRGEAAERPADVAFAQALEGTVAELANALAGDAEHGADLFERVFAAAFETEVEAEHLGVARPGACRAPARSRR